MSSRFPPSSGFNSRDRSPLRFGDRRPPAGPRGPDDGSPPFGREPPRGPRALVDSPRGGHFGGRGRGGYGRGEYRDRDRDLRDRDRDFRDNRDGPPFRRDMDRDWGRRDRDFDPRDNRIGFGRGRSRSPTRDFRDTRELPGRDFDLVRMRRNSRDSILSASSGGPDGPPPNVGHPRGGMRGRGRGDWEGGRGRGRPNFFDDREAFRRRSRSRDAWRDRGRDRMTDRDRGRDIDRDRPLMDRTRVLDRDRDRDIMRERERDRDVDRRERFDRREDWENRRPDQDDREHPTEPWKRDGPPSRTESRAGSIAHAPPPGMGPSPSDRLPPDSSLDLPTRKPSIIPTAVAGGGQENRRDSDRSEPLPPPRPELLKDLGPINQHSPPPSAPQVPAFGSVAAPIPPTAPTKPSSEGRLPSDASAQADKSQNDGPPKVFPQAPTGPKAERNESYAFQAPEARSAPHDAPTRPSPTRPSPSSTQLFHPSPMTAPATARIHSFDGASDSPESNRKPSPVSTSPTTSRLPPPNRSLSRDRSISPRMQASAIPTGPRALQSQPNSSPRGSHKGSKPRGRIGFNRAPSASITPPKKDTNDQEIPMPSSDKSQQDPQPIPSSVTNEPLKDREPKSTLESVKEPSPGPTPVKLPVRENSPPRAPTAEKKSEEPEQVKDQKPEIKDQPAIIPDLAQPSDEDDEEMEGFSDEYLEERKRIFERDMELLRSELPPSPLEDPHIADLLMKIQLLGKLADEDLTADRAEPLPSVEDEEELAPDVSTTERVVTFDPMLLDNVNDEAPQPATEPNNLAHPEVTIDALPFLSAAPPTPPSELEGWHENETSKDHIKEAFRNALIQRRKEVAKKNATLREEYMSFYKPWRLSVWKLDRAKGVRPMTPVPVSASPPALPATSPVPSDSRASREARRHKGNSELDLQNAIQASKLSAQEEEERRRLTMVTARPDLDREAVIPDMLEPQEEKACVYKDFNNVVDPDDAKKIFGFRPLPDQFTPAEHKAFVTAFSKTPKKWGTIAEALPGRDFQECILHYYFTKRETRSSKRWSKARKGKRKTKSKKSNALMADLGVVNQEVEDGDETPAVTDTGRPRRAAAPTFGGDSANDAETPTIGRRSQATRDTELIERAPARQRVARTTTSRARGRGRVIQNDPRSQNQPPVPLPPSQSEGSTPLSALPQMDLGLDGNIESPLPAEREPLERESMPPVAAPRARTGRGRAKEGVYVFESTESDPAMPTKPLETGYGSLQPTSYWSVPEQRDFPRLLAHYGRDFEGISNFMKTKTTVMVKNYYQRRLDSGNKDFEDLLMVAEDKKARGEPTGPLPVPSVAPKRRYEATPSAIIPRPLAPHGDMMTEADEARLKGKPLAMSPQPMPIHARPLTESERASSRYPPLAQASTAASMASVGAALGEESRGIRAQSGQPHRLSGPGPGPGPRMGFFTTDDRRDSSSILPHSTPRAQDMQMPSRHTPGVPMAPELARMDPLSSQSYMSTQGPPSLSSSAHSRRPSLSQLPGSPTQLPRPELDLASVHRDPFSQRQYYQLPGQPAGLSQPHHTVISPVKEIPRPSATPGPDSKVPAKRSNIMSILNDEPEEPQPKKRFASPQPPPSSLVSGASSSSRSAYQLGNSARGDDVITGGTTKPSPYGQPSQYPTPSRGYPEYSSYGPPPGSAGASGNNDWMARFDPRAQQAGAQAQQPPPPQPSSRSSAAMASQNPYSHYASAGPQSTGSLNNVAAPSPVPTPSPASQRPSYPSAFSQQPAPSSSRDPRDMVTQPPAYRPGSPPSRASSVYVTRQEPPTPAQSSASLYGLSRQPGTQSSYSPVSSNSVVQPLSQSYQQHVQTLVNGSHQSHRSTPVSLTGGPSPYGHSTPPPQAQNGRSMPPLASLQRSFTPPSAMHPSVGGNGMGYAPPPQQPGSMPTLHQRPAGPGPLGEPSSTPTHHRVYSQGSLQGGMPGSLHPSSQQPHR